MNQSNKNKKNRGQIHVYTGNGKGKTTAALGLALRAVGGGKKVAIIFFDKGGANYGERKSLLQLAPKLNFFVTGLKRFRPGKPFRFGVSLGDKIEGQKGLDLARELFKKNYDLIILDEINVAAGLGLVSTHQVVTLLKNKPVKIELVLTGRNAPKEILAQADLITEIKELKHYFYQGVPARQGIEY
ncbi:MAG: cob(I)yrinic acid a,c-diamide adenosyltransferase [Candidatus Komeilibacteria bacterium]